MRQYNIAVIGATGNAGRMTLQILAERNFPIGRVLAVASKNSIGQFVSCGDLNLKIQDIDSINPREIDIAIFCAGGAVSKKYALNFAKHGVVIIDKTSAFRLDPKVPLIVPEVNGDYLENGAPLGIIATPNCVATPLTMTLKALSNIAPLKRAVVSTYQSTSGAGKKAIDELYYQTKNIFTASDVHKNVFVKQIAFNVIPSIGVLNNSGSTDEEEKIFYETRKILQSNIQIAVTCVRVPVFIGHGLSVSCEFKSDISEAESKKAFEQFPGIVLLDRRDRDDGFATPIDAQGSDCIFISRIRKDHTVPHGLMYWAVADNLRKGAALNSVQIAEHLIAIDSTLQIFKNQACHT